MVRASREAAKLIPCKLMCTKVHLMSPGCSDINLLSTLQRSNLPTMPTWKICLKASSASWNAPSSTNARLRLCRGLARPPGLRRQSCLSHSVRPTDRPTKEFLPKRTLSSALNSLEGLDSSVWMTSSNSSDSRFS